MSAAINGAPSVPIQQQVPHGNPFRGMQAGGIGMNNNNMFQQMLSAGLPSNFFSALQQQFPGAARESNAALVATAKLAPSKSKKDSNSPTVVRSSVGKLNPGNNGLFTVAQWTRKCVEENLDWLIKLARRHHPKENLILLAYGDGCETLLLIDKQTNMMPNEFRKITKVTIGASMASVDDKGDEEKMASYGVLQPSDSIWDHVQYEQKKEAGKEKKEKCLYIHTKISIWTEGLASRRRVIQVLTGGNPGKPFDAKCYVPNAPFQLNVLAKWNGPTTMALQAPVPPSASAASGETVITFNPKELIILEKAFNETLTPADLRVDCSKYTKKDVKAAQNVIKRAEGIEVRRRGRKPGPKKADTEAEKEKQPEPIQKNVKDNGDEGTSKNNSEKKEEETKDDHKESEGEKGSGEDHKESPKGGDDKEKENEVEVEVDKENKQNARGRRASKVKPVKKALTPKRATKADKGPNENKGTSTKKRKPLEDTKGAVGGRKTRRNSKIVQQPARKRGRRAAAS